MRPADRAGAPRSHARGATLHGLRVQALNISHLARRFVGSLWPAGPRRADESWARAILVAGSGSHALWQRMSNPDRRHAVGVARRVAATGLTERPVLAAALLHDVGKTESGLGTFARVFATLAPWAGRRVRLYRRHAPIGASLLADAGAAPLTVAWAAEHHLPPSRWTVPPAVGLALKAADDD